MQLHGYYLWYGVVYKRQYTDKTLTLRKSMYMRASLDEFRILYILKLLILSIFCWYFRYFVGTNDMTCRLTCSDKFPNVPTKLWKSIIGEGGIAPLPPPPPPPATLMAGNAKEADIYDLAGNLRAKRAANIKI